MPEPVLVPLAPGVPKALQLVERADGVREFADPALRGKVDSILSSVPKVTAVKLNVDYTADGKVAGVFAVQFKAGWSIAVAAQKRKGEAGEVSLGVQKTWP